VLSPLPQLKASAPLARESILVVVDDAGIRAFLMAALEGAGYEVRAAAGRPDLGGIAIVAMSAAENLRRPCCGVRPGATLEKPFDLADLLAAVWVVTNP